jgi:hypothetical protein
VGVLSELIKDPARRRAIIDDGVRVIDAEVARKSGLSGMAIKAGFAVVKGVKPGIIGEALNMFLDDFSARVDPHYDAWKASGQGDLRSHFMRHSSEIADSLLAIVDGRAERSRHATLRKAYYKLRPEGKKHTVEALPAVADMILRHVK